MIDYLAVFIVFFSVIDPIGTVPVFIAVTRQYDRKTKNRIALIACMAAASVLLFFAVAGEMILAAMKVPLPAFQIAGGIVLFLFALSMVFGESKPEEEVRMVERQNDTAIYPLAVPSIAGPGSMLTAVLMTENARFSMLEQAQIVAVMLSVLLITYIFMLISGLVNRMIGTSGAGVISRVMGLILSAVAVTNTLSGLKAYFGI